MGTPALPMADTTEMSNHVSMVGQVSSMPPCCITNNDVTNMKAAQPFMLMVVQMGNTKRATFGCMPNRFSAVSIVTGSVAALLLVKSAVRMAGVIFDITRIGFRWRVNRKMGSTTKNCNRLPPKTTATYFPSESAMTPALSWALSWAANATIPTGRMTIKPRMSVNNTSCTPCRKFTTVFFWGVSAICESAIPMAAANIKSDRTLPSRNGFTMLLGMTLSRWSV